MSVIGKDELWKRVEEAPPGSMLVLVDAGSAANSLIAEVGVNGLASLPLVERFELKLGLDTTPTMVVKKAIVSYANPGKL